MISRKELEARILPRPRKLILTDGAPLTVTPGTVFSLTVPEDAGAAEEKLRKHLAVGEKGLPVTLSYGTAPEGMENSDEGYALALDDSGIRITGFGKTGLFYGVVTLCQLLGREGKGLRLPALEILDWPQKKMRGLFVETRYGTNVMEKADWLQMLDDAAAEYSWDYENAGTPREVTERYVLRNFPGREEETLRALRMMELITEVRVKNLEDPDSTVLSNSYVMRQMLNYYLYSYVQSNRPYPRNFPGEALEEMLKHRDAYERVLLENAAMARQAMDIFTQVADDEHCNRDIARRFAYECRNYLCIAEDWLAILRMQELCNAAEYGKMAKIAACRRDERLKLMAHCEQVKEDYICKGLTMRNHSIFMQMFTDIASYIESADAPCLDMLDISPIMSSRFWELR